MDNRADARASATTLDNLACEEAHIERLFRENVAQQVRRVVAQLPVARDREVVRRFYLEEQHKAAICRDLGLSPINFDKIVFRARRRLKQLFKSSGVQHGELMSAPRTEWCAQTVAAGDL
jgi:RNA polymerase sigma-70 factor (ECF subfamily)